VIVNKNVKQKIQAIKRKKVEKALYIKSFGIVLLNKTALGKPFSDDKKDAYKSANAEVFTPPPVEPEEAPININNKKIKSIDIEAVFKSTVLKPAVLVVTD
jgi:hypothetical protein